MERPAVRRSTLDRIRILAPLRGRDFRLLWTGFSVSLIGDGVFLVAVAWQAFALQNSPVALAGVGLSAAISQLVLSPVGGAIADRMPRRTVLIASDLVRTVVLGALAALGWGGHLELWHLWMAAGIVGAGAAFATPATDAIVPELVAAEHLRPANGLDQVVRPITLRFAGPALGGMVVALVGASGAFLLDACSFAFSAWCMSRVTHVRRPDSHDADREPQAKTSFWTDLVSGVAYVRRRVWLWGTFVGASLAYMLFLGPTEVLLPYIVKNQFGGSAATLGLILAAGGGGALLGAALAGQRHRLSRPVTFIYVCWSGATLLVAVYGIATSRWQLVVAAGLLNGLEAAGAVVWSTLKQRMVPTQLLGRVSSIDWFVSTGLMPVSFVLTPIAAQVLGVRTTFVVAGLVGATITALFLFLPGMREHDHAEAREEQLAFQSGDTPHLSTARG